MAIERTLSIIKPDAVAKNVIGQIYSRFEGAGLKIAAAKLVHLSLLPMGKDERGRDDAKVQAKRKAAEALVRRLVAENAYAGQHWGYLIAYEQDTARADSWEDLKAFASPVSNAL